MLLARKTELWNAAIEIHFALLFFQQFAASFGEAWAVDAVMLKNFLLASCHRVVVREPHDFEPCMDSFLQQQPGACFAQASVYTVFFHCDHPASFGSGFADRSVVQRLERVQAQNPALDAFLG